MQGSNDSPDFTAVSNIMTRSCKRLHASECSNTVIVDDIIAQIAGVVSLVHYKA